MLTDCISLFYCGKLSWNFEVDYVTRVLISYMTVSAECVQKGLSAWQSCFNYRTEIFGPHTFPNDTHAHTITWSGPLLGFLQCRDSMKLTSNQQTLEMAKIFPWSGDHRLSSSLSHKLYRWLGHQRWLRINPLSSCPIFSCPNWAVKVHSSSLFNIVFRHHLLSTSSFSLYCTL